MLSKLSNFFWLLKLFPIAFQRHFFFWVDFSVSFANFAVKINLFLTALKSLKAPFYSSIFCSRTLPHIGKRSRTFFKAFKAYQGNCDLSKPSRPSNDLFLPFSELYRPSFAFADIWTQDPITLCLTQFQSHKATNSLFIWYSQDFVLEHRHTLANILERILKALSQEIVRVKK